MRIVQVGTSAELTAYADVRQLEPAGCGCVLLYKAAEQVLFRCCAYASVCGLCREVPVVSGELFLSEKGNTADCI
ncbi:MAG: hypothetical protein ACLSHC_05710 [Bilophila wadsworthia]